MLEKMPDILAAIPAAAWALSCRAGAASEDVNTTLLKTLAKTHEGRTILLKIKGILIDHSYIVTMINKLMLSTEDRQTITLPISTSTGVSETTGAKASGTVSISTRTLLERQGFFQTATLSPFSGDTVSQSHSKK